MTAVGKQTAGQIVPEPENTAFSSFSRFDRADGIDRRCERSAGTSVPWPFLQWSDS